MVALSETTVVKVAIGPRGTVSGPFGSSISKKFFVDEGVPVIRGNNLSLGTNGPRFYDDGFVFVSDEKANELSSAECRPGDLIFTARGTIGQVGLIPSNARFRRYILSANQLRLRPDPNLVDALYLYYWFSTYELVSLMQGLNAGSALPNMNLGMLRSLPVRFPPLPEQRAIAHILGSLDDKIELNRRMNETLEEMARALFKSWFVDFDPVRAKMDGRWRRGQSLPGLPADLYDLFPDRLVPSELGEIPERWEVKALKDCIDTARGLSYKGSGLSSRGVPMHNLNSVYEGGGYKEEGIKYYNGDHKARHVAQPGDVLVANTEQGHDRLLIGFAAIVPERLGDCGLFSHHIYRVRPKSPSVLSPDFLCQLLNTQVIHDTVSGYANGTTVNMLPVDALSIPSIVLPSLQLIAIYSTIAESARTRQDRIIAESHALAAQRDALLPRLVSGEVRRVDSTYDEFGS